MPDDILNMVINANIEVVCWSRIWLRWGQCYYWDHSFEWRNVATCWNSRETRIIIRTTPNDILDSYIFLWVTEGDNVLDLLDFEVFKTLHRCLDQNILDEIINTEAVSCAAIHRAGTMNGVFPFEVN